MNRFNFIFTSIIAITFTMSCTRPEKQESIAKDSTITKDSTTVLYTLTDQERTEGWELLFDGRTLDGWKLYNRDTIGPLWSVQGGAIIFDSKNVSKENKDVQSLVSIRQFGNFDLQLEWKISTGGNSGVLYHVVEDPKYKFSYETGPEYQVLDDIGWTGETLRPTQLSGSSYDMYPAPVSKKILPAGEWNTARIVYNNGHVEHWMNGEKIIEFEEGNDDYKKRYKKSKWVEYPGWNKSKTGSISLQDHGSPVYYRNIRIKAL